MSTSFLNDAKHDVSSKRHNDDNNANSDAANFFDDKFDACVDPNDVSFDANDADDVHSKSTSEVFRRRRPRKRPRSDWIHQKRSNKEEEKEWKKNDVSELGIQCDQMLHKK